MPLNPPSYSGQDVWYSPDVYINQVQAALWQPPQSRAIPENMQAKMQAYIQGEDTNSNLRRLLKIKGKRIYRN